MPSSNTGRWSALLLCEPVVSFGPGLPGGVAVGSTFVVVPVRAFAAEVIVVISFTFEVTAADVTGM